MCCFLCQKPFFITYEAGLHLTNGIVYNLAGIQRYKDAFMTYEGKSFLSRFYLKINKLQVNNAETTYNTYHCLSIIEGKPIHYISFEDQQFQLSTIENMSYTFF